MCPVQVRKADEKDFEAYSFGFGKAAFAMPGRCALVFAFELVETREDCRYPRLLYFPQSRKKAVFFIGGMFRRSVAKVFEGRCERMAVLVI